MSGEPGNQEAQVQLVKEPPRTRSVQMAKPPRSLGESVKYYLRRTAAPVMLAVGTTAAAFGVSAIDNQPPPETTGSVPNQPGQVHKTPEPAPEITPQITQQPELSIWQNNAWVNNIRAKLAGEIEPDKELGEEAVGRMEVISLGEPDVIGPNLREYPSNLIPADWHPDSRITDVPVLGIINPGSIVDHGIVVHGILIDRERGSIDVRYLAFRLGDFHGTIIDDHMQPVQDVNPSEEPNRIVVAPYSYFQRIPQPAQAPIPTS